jgi:hypothetical protein
MQLNDKKNAIQIFKIDNAAKYQQELVDKNMIITDSALVKNLAMILGDDFGYYLNFFTYYFILEDLHKDFQFVRTDDYSIRKYLIIGDFTHVKSCVEIAAEGGDGAELFYEFSEKRNDSLITYLITEKYLLDSITDTILNRPPIIDTMIKVVKLNQ